MARGSSYWNPGSGSFPLQNMNIRNPPRSCRKQNSTKHHLTTANVNIIKHFIVCIGALTLAVGKYQWMDSWNVRFLQDPSTDHQLPVQLMNGTRHWSSLWLQMSRYPTLLCLQMTITEKLTNVYHGVSLLSLILKHLYFRLGHVILYGEWDQNTSSGISARTNVPCSSGHCDKPISYYHFTCLHN